MKSKASFVIITIQLFILGISVIIFTSMYIQNNGKDKTKDTSEYTTITKRIGVLEKDFKDVKRQGDINTKTVNELDEKYSDLAELDEILEQMGIKAQARYMRR